MALSIKTEEADRLARHQRDRDCAKPRTPEEQEAAVDAILARVRPDLDMRPMTKAEWDEASGD
jgi:hypothetical protein